VLVVSPPAGPSQPVQWAVGGLDDQGGEQVGDFVAGQRNLPGGCGAAGPLGGGGDGKERGGQHGEGDPAVPGGPGADLVFVEPGQALAGLDAFFDGPPAPGDFDQGGQRDMAGAVAAVEGQFPGAAVAADQQPPVPGPAGVDGQPGPVVVAVALGASPVE
jgi:hypothetical protein